MDGDRDGVNIIPPAIDPLSPKNMAFSPEDAAFVCNQFGIDVDRPLITQVSRFDPWKDPIGVIDAYREVTEQVPEAQLALVGSMATDDPEGWEFFQKTFEYADGDPDIKILNNLNNVGAIEVNAFQSQSDVCLQKSIREGFGLTVTEALWKGRPTIGGNVGGIPLQIEDGVTGFLVDSPAECAAALPRDPRRPRARQAARPGRQGARPRAVPLAAPAARLARAASRELRHLGRAPWVAGDGLGSPLIIVSNRGPPQFERDEDGERHGAPRRRRPGHRALRPGLPPRRALDRLGDDRRGRRRLRGGRRRPVELSIDGIDYRRAAGRAATPRPTTASTT